jgi:hypothetical protein
LLVTRRALEGCGMVLSGNVSSELVHFPTSGRIRPNFAMRWKNPPDPNLAILAVNAMANFADWISLMR